MPFSQQSQVLDLPRVTQRIALVNEWVEQTGGAEQVLFAARRTFPTADTFVLWDDRTGADCDPAPTGDSLTESWLARTPLRGRKALSLPLVPFVWRTQTRHQYDVVLSLSHGLNHTARLPVAPGGVHLSYVHTPARYLWLRDIDPRRSGPGQRVAVAAVKSLERRTSRHVTSYAANSEAVRRRIRDFWHRDARVIHPPCRIEFFSSAPAADRDQNREYLLGYGRWVGYKRYDFMIEVAARARLPLVLAGCGPEEANLRRLAAASAADVRFVVRPDDESLRRLVWGARALLHPGHEDFGMVAVEAQACGTPVVGLGVGGLLDTVVDGRTGHYVPALDPLLFAKAVHSVDDLDRRAVTANAERFSERVFAERLATWVDDLTVA